MVTGGAGYIGSHVVRELAKAEIPVLVFDNLSTGVASFIPEDVPSIHADLLDSVALSNAMAQHSVTGVIHIAGYKFAGQSVERPLHTYQQNVVAMMNLLHSMSENGVRKIVFSSSSSVYGNAASGLVDEHYPFNPTSPYGESKVIGEWLLRNQGVATGLTHTSLRYFNVVGSGDPELPDVSPYNLFSMVFAGLENNRTPVIFGDDYDTPDGTCIRDYIHVADLARAHVSAAVRMDRGDTVEQAYNLGSGVGTSVAEMMGAISRVTGIDFVPEIGPRRAGDPARVVASGNKAAQDIDWSMRFGLDDMIRSAYEARANIPHSDNS